MDIRLKTTPFEFEGKTYMLCCNMNVLADVQEAFGGDLNAALTAKTSVRSTLEFLAAMLNDCADGNGWPERYTVKQLGRKLPAILFPEVAPMVWELVHSACADPDGENSDSEDHEKNAEPRQSGAE